MLANSKAEGCYPLAHRELLESWGWGWVVTWSDLHFWEI